MPVLVGFLVVSMIAGLSLPPLAARLVTATAALLTLGVFVWAAADGQGDDPPWIIVLAVAGVAIGAAVCETLIRRRLIRPTN